jgi:hypothetical protein
MLAVIKKLEKGQTQSLDSPIIEMVKKICGPVHWFSGNTNKED